MITAYADVSGAVEAMRAGAHDYMPKPFEHYEVIRVVRRALAERELKRRLAHLSLQLQDIRSLRELMGSSDVVGWLISDVNRVAKSDLTVVILGETGTGKELVAHAIHKASPRSGCPFTTPQPRSLNWGRLWRKYERSVRREICISFMVSKRALPRALT
ncbi:MAG: sigma 54-interacting transcriptional regulator [candidate division Zixibacteria bacterium]|nr:sigma 54-interacting transcriptional regulator [Candidatus Tariuqbacter arcticus]